MKATRYEMLTVRQTLVRVPQVRLLTQASLTHVLGLAPV